MKHNMKRTMTKKPPTRYDASYYPASGTTSSPDDNATYCQVEPESLYASIIDGQLTAIPNAWKLVNGEWVKL